MIKDKSDNSQKLQNHPSVENLEKILVNDLRPHVRAGKNLEEVNMHESQTELNHNSLKGILSEKPAVKTFRTQDENEY